MTTYGHIFHNKNLLTEISHFCDIRELLLLKSINKTTSRLDITLTSIIKRIDTNKYKIIPTAVANRLYLYFLKIKNYNSLLKVIPFTESIVSFRIFIDIDVIMSEKILGMIRKKPTILTVPKPCKVVWYSPYHVVEETFGLNIKVFKYAVDLCVVYGLSYLLSRDKFYSDTPEDIPFVEYIESMTV